MNASPRDIRISLLVLAGLITFVCIGLALDTNWPKVLRVSMAFATYALGVVALTRALGPRLVAFAIAGAAAGLVSGIVRPELDAALALVSILGGVAFAAAHQLALSRWRSLANHLPRST